MCRFIANLVLAFLPLVLAGCQGQPDISRYQVERHEPKLQPAAQVDLGPVRFLGAIAVSGDKMWFFKVSGSDSNVKPIVGDFDKFVRSIRFPAKGDAPVTWELPKDWQAKPGNQFRFATLLIPGPEGLLDLSVSALPGDANTVRDNVNRWRDQIALPKVDDAELAKVTQKLDVAGVQFTVLDMVGKGGAPKMPPFAKQPPPQKQPQQKQPPREVKLPFTVEVPKEWTDRGPRTGVLASYLSAGPEGKGKAQITITPLGGDGGGVLANVNRWRDQIGLQDQLTEDQLGTVTKVFDSPEIKGLLVDVANPKEQGRIVGLIMPRGKMTWFFKMTGDLEWVGQQKPVFEAFLRSVRFNKEE